MIHGWKRSPELWISYLEEDPKRISSKGLVREGCHLTLRSVSSRKHGTFGRTGPLNTLLLSELRNTGYLTHRVQIWLDPFGDGCGRKQALAGVVAVDQILVGEVGDCGVGAIRQAFILERRDKIAYRQEPEASDGFVVAHLAVVRAEGDQANTHLGHGRFEVIFGKVDDGNSNVPSVSELGERVLARLESVGHFSDLIFIGIADGLRHLSTPKKQPPRTVRSGAAKKN